MDEWLHFKPIINRPYQRDLMAVEVGNFSSLIERLVDAPEDDNAFIDISFDSSGILWD